MLTDSTAFAVYQDLLHRSGNDELEFHDSVMDLDYDARQIARQDFYEEMLADVAFGQTGEVRPELISRARALSEELAATGDPRHAEAEELFAYLQTHQG